MLEKCLNYHKIAQKGCNSIAPPALILQFLIFHFFSYCTWNKSVLSSWVYSSITALFFDNVYEMECCWAFKTAWKKRLKRILKSQLFVSNLVTKLLLSRSVCLFKNYLRLLGLVHFIISWFSHSVGFGSTI